MTPRSLPPLLHQQQQRPVGHRLEWFFWTLVSLSTLIYLAAAGNDNSFHDFLGGRFPVADGFDWLKASLDAASGYRTDYGVRRPWNLPFNVASLWLGHRIGPDPLVSALAIKRLLALASIAAVLTALRPRLTLIATAGLGALLVSTLPRFESSPFLDFTGQGLGYTHGSELNAFIFVNVALAWFVLGNDSLKAGRFREHAIRSAAGFLLLTLAVQARPGTLGLLPSLAVLVAVAAGRLGSQGKQPSWAWRRLLSILLLALLGWLLISGGQLALERNLARTACGSIGANSGGSIMGMATGQTWREALKETNETGLPGCGRELSRIQRNIGIERLRSNPLPFLNLLKRNTLMLLSLPSVLLTLICPWILMLALTMQKRSLRWREDRANSGELLIIGLALCGSLSIIAFQFLFFSEAGLRPSTPYSIFPFLLLIGTVDKSLVVISPSFSPAGIQSRHGPFIAPLLTLALAAYLTVGMLLIHRQALLSAGYGQVTGSIQVTPGWLKEWTDYRAISPSIEIMYQSQISPDLTGMTNSEHQIPALMCVHYSRRGLPWGMPFGKLSITRGQC
ncbi:MULTISPECIES: hypothetical protein [unclassified Cyanobium]|uniref:hypothetical protein n=1 Tax=unclassified Cyanobium TaxID=2627006 RepID=UPI0020CF0809|nr:MULTISPECIES: hypothetical protein [unclassified Cyanobium]MCP9833947.1 hypothetical protein [Cyanobium sp. La Preciosa 7G6]MCP9936710.1 hypothetical protein [Cyanobium sp. Aljojuca 7A6]